MVAQLGRWKPPKACEGMGGGMSVEVAEVACWT